MDELVIKREQPKNYLAWSIVSTVLCFPFGIPAIFNATKVNSLWKDGHYEEAEKASRKAKRWAVTGVVCNAVFYTLYVIGIVTIVVTALHKSHDASNTDVDNSPMLEEFWEDKEDDGHPFI